MLLVQNTVLEREIFENILWKLTKTARQAETSGAAPYGNAAPYGKKVSSRTSPVATIFVGPMRYRPVI